MGTSNEAKDGKQTNHKIHNTILKTLIANLPFP